MYKLIGRCLLSIPPHSLESHSTFYVVSKYHEEHSYVWWNHIPPFSVGRFMAIVLTYSHRYLLLLPDKQRWNPIVGSNSEMTLPDGLR